MQNQMLGGENHANGSTGKLPVLVIGSGSTGLALAQGLRKAGIQCTVFERRQKDALSHERDWNMGLHWAAPVLQTLLPEHWWSRIQSVQVNPHVPTKDHDSVILLRGDTGEVINSIPVRRLYRLRRSKLRALLSEDLHVEYGKRLSNITYADDGKSVTAHFDDGTSATGSLLVGADGARSMTRQCLLGPEKGIITRLPFSATFIQQTFTAEQARYLSSFHPLYLASVHPSSHFAFFGMHNVEDPEDPTTWTFFFYISWRSSSEEQEATKDWTAAQRVAQQKELAKKFCDPWKSALEWTSADSKAWHMSLTDWDPGREGYRWDNHGGRVTMVGDAVHPMTYQRGQGLNHCITDAGKLRDALVKIEQGEDQKEAITAFEDEMIRRSGEEVRLGTSNTRLLHEWEEFKHSPLMTKGMSKTN